MSKTMRQRPNGSQTTKLFDVDEPIRRFPFLPALEGIRGVALFTVMAVHTGLYVVPALRQWLLPGAEISMAIFFGLSGFLISSLLLIEYGKNGRIKIGDFYYKRARRIYPPLLLILAGHGVMAFYYKRSMSLEAGQDAWAVLMAINYKYSIPNQDPFIGYDVKILWSLAVEAQFYLVWPFLMILFIKYFRTLKGLLLSILALAVVANIIQAVQYSWWNNWAAVYYRTEGRFVGFFMGGALAFAWYHKKIPLELIRKLAWPAWLIFLIGYWTTNLRQPFLYQWGWFAFSVLAMILIAACLDTEFIISKWLSFVPLRFAGRVSYSFYIMHSMVFFWVLMEREYLPGIQRAALAWGVTFVLGMIVYWVAERPFLARPSLRVDRAKNSEVSGVNE